MAIFGADWPSRIAWPWPGTAVEAQHFVQAVDHNCYCGVWSFARCGAHHLYADRESLPRLIFWRRNAFRLTNAEWHIDASLYPSKEPAAHADH